ncbi:hypothetical protein FZC66_02145 [Priestia megaterium]|nr:hypothetical protein FZC66_02145 [Priestia megaterium]
MKRLLGLLVLLVVGVISYQMRYRFVNVFFGNSIIRKLVVHSLFNLPYVRDRLLNQVFRSASH